MAVPLISAIMAAVGSEAVAAGAITGASSTLSFESVMGALSAAKVTAMLPGGEQTDQNAQFIDGVLNLEGKEKEAQAKAALQMAEEAEKTLQGLNLIPKRITGRGKLK